ESAILSSETVMRLSIVDRGNCERSGNLTNASSNAATQNKCTCVNSESKARTATISKCTLVDLCTIRSGSECNQKKKTPTASTAPTRTRAITPRRMSGEPGGVMKGGVWVTAAGCLVVSTTSGGGIPVPSPLRSSVSKINKAVN